MNSTLKKISKILGGIVLLIASVIFWMFLYNMYDEKKAVSLIPHSSIEFIEIALQDQFGSYKVVGELKNNSKYNLFNVYLDITIHDCPTDTITPSCSVIGEDENVIISTNIPPNQVRAFNAYVSLYSMPKLRGKFIWTYKITKTWGRK